MVEIAISIKELEAKIMAQIDDINAQLDQIIADATAESTLIDSISAVVTGLQTQLTAALANESISGPTQAKINQIFAAAEANKAKLAAAVLANTPEGDGTQTGAGTNSGA